MMAKKKQTRMFVLVREDWNGKLIHVPWMYKYNLKGYNLAIEHEQVLKKLFPNRIYNLKCFDFNYGQETEVQVNINDLKG